MLVVAQPHFGCLEHTTAGVIWSPLICLPVALSGLAGNLVGYLHSALRR